MFGTPFFSGLSELLAGIRAAPGAATQAKKLADGLAATQVRAYQVETGADGKGIVNYAALGLAPGSTPRVVFMVKLPAGAMPVVANIEGEPTQQQVTIRCMRLTSVVNLGLLSSYTPVSGLKVDVYVRPVA